MKDRQTVDFLKEKWKKDIVAKKAEWDKDPGWPAKLVETEFELNGIKYIIRPADIGLSDDCWDQGLMESFQSVMKKDLKEYGAVNIYNTGFLD